MFGFGRQRNQQSATLPYEVYESAQESTYHRRQWLYRLVGGLLLATILIVGGVTVRNILRNDDAKPASSQSKQASKSTGGNTAANGQSGSKSSGNNSGATAPQAVSQSPQQTNLPSTGSGAPDPATIQQSTGDNTGTVRKPE